MTDDDTDDSKLRQLRAVWVSMRDESPPERGLAALLAAASDQADKMKSPPQVSWWQRLLRPPVLAFASVIVLIGGALVISQRHAEVESSAPSPGSPVTSPPPAAGIAPGGAADGSAAAPAIADPTPVETVEAETKAAPEGAHAADRKADPKVGGKGDFQAKGEVQSTAKPRAQPAVKTPPQKPQAQNQAPRDPASGDDSLSFEAGLAADSPAVAPRDEAAPGRARVTDSARPTAAPESNGTGTGKAAAVQDLDRRDNDTERQIKQCEAAAARGDCEVVKRLAQSLAKSAPALYKSRVTKNAAIVRCLQ